MRSYFTAFFLLLSLGLLAQNSVVLENTSALTKWKQIKTPHFTLIYQPEIAVKAQELANMLEQNYNAVTSSLNATPRRISIILQNEYAISNGFVSLSPRRSEFFTTSPQDYNFIGNNEWLDLLSIHEFRHVVQYESSRKGLTKLVYYIFGQNGQAGMSNISAPNWYWEGDATMTETALSKSGRGRIPAFDRAFRANLLEGKRFKYHKQALNSYKDFVPNHYVLGYHFTTHLRRRTKDPEIWSKVTGKAFSLPVLPFIFSTSLKRNTGMFVIDNYETMMDELKSEWETAIEGIALTEYTPLIEHPQDFVNYAYPQPLADGSTLVLQSGLSYYDSFQRISKDGKIKKVFVPGIMNKSGNLSLAQNKLVWAEYEMNARWAKKNYSVIKLYDLDTKKMHRLTPKQNMASPALDPEAKAIVAVKNLANGTNTLVVLDAETGKELHALTPKEGVVYFTPSYSDSGNQIVAIILANGKKSVVSWDTKLKVEKILFTVEGENIGQPRKFGSHLFYNSDYSGIDNIYAYNLENNTHFQVTESKYGAYNAEVSAQNLVYNDYSVNGLSAVSTKLDASKWKTKNNAIDRGIDYIGPVQEQEGNRNVVEEKEFLPLEEKKYSLFSRLVNIHSWGPYASTSFDEVQLGIFSQDVMSQLWLYGGYTLNVDGSGKAEFKASYQGLFPILDFGYSSGNRQDTFQAGGNETKATWKEENISAGVRFPFNFTRSKYYTRMSVAGRYVHTKVKEYDQPYRPIDVIDNGSLSTTEVEFRFSNLLKQSKRDINSKFGQSIYFLNQTSPSGSDFTAGQWSSFATLYFPGFVNHHSLYGKIAYQHKESNFVTDDTGSIFYNDTYWYNNRIPFPRGYASRTYESFTTLQTNYALPLWNADVAMGPILNIQRVRLNLFYDYGKGQNTATNVNTGIENTFDREFISYGAELMLDVNVMRFWPEFSLGVRTSYLKGENRTVTEFLLGAFPF